MGIEAQEVIVEVDAWKGLPKVQIVGLPDSVIKESKNRIKSAIKHSAYEYKHKVYTISLAPAELQKEGAFFDVPMALGMLAVNKQITLDTDALYIGELSLNGDVRPVRGVICICHMALKKGIKKIVVPYDNYEEAALIEGLDIRPIRCLGEIEDILSAEYIAPSINKNRLKRFKSYDVDFGEVRGQLAAKRALEIAAAGQHNILFVGPPGSGKTMLLKRLPTILPEMNSEELIEVQKVRSISGEKIRDKGFSYFRPYRSPHHTISYAGMVGGGSKPMPGEISLAHEGVLFLDELPEFQRQVLEVLRQPIEEKKIAISRASFSIEYPARFMFVAAMNPCPCGYHNDLMVDCSCQNLQIKKYWKKISGPIIDRIDIIMEIPRLKKMDFIKDVDNRNNRFTSIKMKERVDNARKTQMKRFGKNITNGDMGVKLIEQHCKVDREIKDFLGGVVERGLLTGRSYHSVLKVARTIADIEQEEFVLMRHVAEAVQYRKMVLS